MMKRSERTVFWIGFLAYAASFLLPFAGGPGIYRPKPSSGAETAVDWFFFPLIYAHLHSLSSFWIDAPIKNVSIAISSWINPLFFLTVLFQAIGKTPQLTKTLRTIILSMLPFCWIAFLVQRVYPREGYLLWTGGILLVLFSRELERRRSRWASAST